MKAPNAKITSPTEIYLGLLAPSLPPKYVTGIISSRDPISKDEAIVPDSVDFRENLLSIEVITTLISP